MKIKAKQFIFLTFTLLAHYFVLTYFQVDAPEAFIGKVEKIEKNENGLFPKTNIKFSIEEEKNGEKKIITKIVSLAKDKLQNIEIGKTYSVKLQDQWLVSMR
jgi:hypothetical protein